ncbi:MAG: sigma-70 family RNA polymerase sigma factor [Firmicutes bacterium]|nr:sigma-70 family RNA polymerase sigma factor [Bacillota bacterium]
MEDRAIVDLYWQRSESAVPETVAKYGPYCRAIAERILGNREDVEECLNDTWLAAWNAIPPERPVLLRPYLAKIARNLAFDCYRARTAEKRGGGETPLVLDELAECLADGTDTEKAFEAEELGRAVRAFTRDLPEREGNVFLRRYFFNESAAEIANRYGLTETNVRVLLSRTRKKLKARLTEEGFV